MSNKFFYEFHCFVLFFVFLTSNFLFLCDISYHANHYAGLYLHQQDTFINSLCNRQDAPLLFDDLSKELNKQLDVDAIVNQVSILYD